MWEYRSDGSVFERRQAIEELDGWRQRVEALYADVELWARADGLEVRRDRIVPMAEEFMQNFAVPDPEMPGLDVLDSDRPVISFVPAGLLIGFRGLIEAITRRGTFRLEDVRGSEPPGWTVIHPRTRTRTGWNSEALRSMLGLIAADE